jgi:carboxyl-terminal processing protease
VRSAAQDPKRRAARRFSAPPRVAPPHRPSTPPTPNRQAEGVDGGFVLDLRSNPGGLVQSAADVARVFMDGNPTLFTVSGRAGEKLQEVILEDGPSETAAPLAVLVNHGSASASEILSGALRDNRRAVVIGDEKTYGKGRIQSVFEMVRRRLGGRFGAGVGC